MSIIYVLIPIAIIIVAVAIVIFFWAVKTNQFEDLEVAQLLLTGPGAAIGQLDDFFMQRLSLPASKVDPIEVLGLETEVEIPPEQRYGLGIVLGLGLREV